MLKILIRTQNASLYSLEADAFTAAQPSSGVKGINAFTPPGVLGGQVAMITGNYVCGIADGTGKELGLFLNDAAGEAFNNTPAVASGKVAVVKGFASVEVDVYADESYAVGEKLYADANGFLTNVPGAGSVVGIVTKVPTTESPTLGVDLRV